jgi:hypothetical protein
MGGEIGAGGGNGGMVPAMEQPDNEVAEDREGVRGMAGAGSGALFAEDDSADPMEGVRDAPMGLSQAQQVPRARLLRGEGSHGVAGLGAQHLPCALVDHALFEPEHLAGKGPGDVPRVRNREVPRLNPPVGETARAYLPDIAGRPGGGALNVGPPRGLVALDDHQVRAPVLHDLGGDPILREVGIHSHRLAAQRQAAQQWLQRREFMAASATATSPSTSVQR